MTTGRLFGIARHGEVRGPVETLDQATVTIAEGLAGDVRGTTMGRKPSRARQISLIESESWTAAMDQLDNADLHWWQTRRNLLIGGLRLPRQSGVRIAIGPSVVIESTMECDPCARMDAICPGLREALVPDWRGGVLGRVLEEGVVTIDDEVRIL